MADANIELPSTVYAIGAYVIGFGHLEHTVMRVVEWLNGNPSPGTMTTSVLRLNWTDLLARLRRDAANSPVADEVDELLTLHEIDLCSDIRNHLVHGSVDVTQAPEIMIIRRFRDGSKPIILTSRQDIEEYSAHVAKLSAGLDRVMPETYRRVTSNLVAGVIGMTRESAIAAGIDPDRPYNEQVEFDDS